MEVSIAGFGLIQRPEIGPISSEKINAANLKDRAIKFNENRLLASYNLDQEPAIKSVVLRPSYHVLSVRLA